MGQGLGALGALPLIRDGGAPWPETDPADRILNQWLAEAAPDSLAAAVAEEAAARLDRFVAGVRAYWAHPYRRPQDAPAPVIWRSGTTRVTDHGRHDGPAGTGTGAPSVLLVPSLVNRAYILDLAPGRSLIDYLAGRRIRPFLVDWQSPGPAEQGFDLTAYVQERLVPAVRAVRAHAPGPLIILGYCMGGLLALALALQPDIEADGLALLATPWDFHAETPDPEQSLGRLGTALTPLLHDWGGLPVDLLQWFFAALNPGGVVDKFRHFALLKPDGQAARQFVQVEDWLNDGVPLAAPAAIECFRDWYGANQPGCGAWIVAGRKIRPEDWHRPAWVAIPRNDRIVPPESATALARALPDAAIHRPRAGHIGLVVGSGARQAIWSPLADWMLGLARSP